jgi:hypothetical protein
MGGNVGKTKDIRRAVEAELAFDPLVDAANITAKDTNGEARRSKVGGRADVRDPRSPGRTRP